MKNKEFLGDDIEFIGKIKSSYVVAPDSNIESFGQLLNFINNLVLFVCTNTAWEYRENCGYILLGRKELQIAREQDWPFYLSVSCSKQFYVFKGFELRFVDTESLLEGVINVG